MSAAQPNSAVGRVAARINAVRQPRLEVLEHVRWWRRVSWWEVAAGLLLVGVLVAALMVHVSMIGAQERLDDVQAELKAARLKQEELRRAESQLTSPGEVLAIAQNELGMIDAQDPEFVLPTPRAIRPQALPDAPVALPGGDDSDPNS